MQRGQITTDEVRNAALVSAALMIVLAIPLGWAAELVLIVAVGAAWAHNAWLEKTVLSIAPHLIHFRSTAALFEIDPSPISGR